MRVYPPEPGVSSTERGRGFTLIEILVVLVIMSVLLGMVSVLAQPDGKALLRVEAERLAQLLDLAAAESRLAGKPIAWTADGRGYRFWQASEDALWFEIDDDLLRPRSLPSGMRISRLRVEGRASPEPMRVEFHPQGRVLFFSVDISLDAAHYTVANSPIGEVRVLHEGPGASNELAQR